MVIEAQIRSFAISIARARFRGELQAIELVSSEARGGLESRAVKRVQVRGRDPSGNPRSLRLVVKQLEGINRREAGVYRELLSQLEMRIAPNVLRVEQYPKTGVILFLEDVQATRRWPWRELPSSAAVLQQLAGFHEVSQESAAVLPPWDYESALLKSAVATLEGLQQLHRHPEFAWMRRSLKSADRLVSALPNRRAELLDFEPYGSGPIHGDVHPGNVILRSRRNCDQPVLIDWARARMGSALEDVSSWLQSLAYWEPEARRRHDTLLMSYVRARGHEPRLSSSLRGAYWMAAGSNALAGALRYYCWKADAANDLSQRSRAIHAVRDWMRMVERADALSRR